MTNRQKTIYETEPDSVPKGRAKKQCHCGKWFTLPQCHAARHRSCSEDCAATLRKAEHDAMIARLERRCEACGEVFAPRQWQVDTGGGRYCSHACASKVLTTTKAWRDAIPARAAGWRRAFDEGRVPIYSGPEHRQWKGGPKAAQRRRIESGKAAAYTAKYRKANPIRAKEWGYRRKGKKVSRLPRGTIPALFEKQRGKCAFCRKSIKAAYHVDHIIALAKGGAHEPLNLQLLCGPCNVRKWTYHPVEFAQKYGKLL